MDYIVNKIVGLGIPGLMLLVAMSMTGLSGAAAITAGLALLGPGGMIGGIMMLVLASAISSALAEYGFDAIFKAVVLNLYKKGESKETIATKIKKAPFSSKLKKKALYDLERL